ncbi:MAG: sporulation integral membrane protein YtvI [Lachnospiraceae bacterium]|nr:sporulation integral membrane protein YtvI [Lachnospiraceae bacterium]MDY4069563.1 sporulation integral membrane protein YtvI [Lachnospiraceae bacterium]
MKQPYKRYLKVFMNLLLAVVIILLCVFAVPKVLVFFMPFVIGWIIACVANPLVRFFEDKFMIRRKAGSAVVIIAVIALVILAAYLAVSKLISESIGFLNMLPDLWNTMESDFREIGKNLDVMYSRLPQNMQMSIEDLGQQMDEYVADLVKRLGTPTVNAVGNFAKNIPGFVINVIMCLLSSYFFVAEKDYVAQVWNRYMPGAVKHKAAIIMDSLKTAVGGYFKAQFKIECLIFVFLLTGFLILKIPYALLIAFLIAVLDFLPFFGAGAVMVPWAVFKFLSADYKMAIWLLIIWGVGQLVRQIIQPKLVGDSVGVAPLPTLFLLFIGYKCAGVIGIILAVPIGIVLINLNQAGVFDSVKTSLCILAEGFNRFRRFDESDKAVGRRKDDE